MKNNDIRNNHDRFAEDEKPIDIRDLWYKFLHRKNIFMYIAIPIFLGIVISQFTKPYNPIYRAAFDIGVLQEKPVEGLHWEHDREQGKAESREGIVGLGLLAGRGEGSGYRKDL